MTMPTSELQEALRQRMSMLDSAHEQLEEMAAQQSEEGRQLTNFAEQCGRYRTELGEATQVARSREQAAHMEGCFSANFAATTTTSVSLTLTLVD